MCRKKLVEDRQSCAVIYVSTVVVSIVSTRGISLPLLLYMAVLNATTHF